MIEDKIIWRKIITSVPVTIPEGSIKCPDCDGEGETLWAYCDPGPNEYKKCILCGGMGYIDEGWYKHHLKFLQKSSSPSALKTEESKK